MPCFIRGQNTLSHAEVRSLRCVIDIELRTLEKLSLRAGRMAMFMPEGKLLLFRVFNREAGEKVSHPESHSRAIVSV
jgi:hypothetical protein